MDKPFTFMLIPLIFGILFNHLFKISLYYPIFIMIFILLYLLYNIIKRNLNQNILLLLFFTMGMILSMVSDKSTLISFIDKTHTYKGTVHKTLLEDFERSRYIIKVQEVDGKPIEKENIVLNIIEGKNLVIGDTIEFNGKVKLPSRNTNPNLYNYRLNLKSKWIHTTATIKDHNIKTLHSGHRGLGPRLKASTIERIQSLFEDHLNPRNADLMISIILGKSSYLEEDFLKLYREMGLAHILAVSGLHIGIISGFIFFILSRMGIKKKVNIILTLGTIWIYGYLIDFPPSILRANIMFTILYYSQLIHEPYDSLNTLSFAALVLLIINPYYLFNIGFQLSFGATLSILILYPRIKAIFASHKGKFVDTLAALFGVHMGLLPIQAYYFNNISLLSILANIMIVPILSFSIILGASMITFSYGFNFINTWLGFVLNLLLNIQLMILKILDSIPFNIIKVFSPHIISIITYYILIICILKIIDLEKLDFRIKKFIVISMIFISIINIFIFSEEDFLELHFIDVGQGDALLIRNGSTNHLVDTGGSITSSFDIGKNITLPYLEKNGVRNLNSVFISHFHEDHSQGLSSIMKEINISNIYSSYFPFEYELGEEIKASNIPFSILKRGDYLHLDDLVKVEILWPEKDSIKRYNENNLSLLCLVKFQDYKILLTGDLEKEGESILANTLDTVDVIKVPHHGSPTSSSEEFLQALEPAYGIIPVGRNNLYGHPNQEVVNRYEGMGTQVHRTDESGLVILRLDKSGIKIKTYLENGEKLVLTPWGFIEDHIFEFSLYSLFFLMYYILIKIYIGGRNNYELL